MRKLAIIPARGGSKRIPRKNIRNFLGKPIIAYSIETAIKSQLFDEVMVSTEDQEIAQIAKSYGASIPFMRSKKNADDFATTMDVLEEVTLKYKEDSLFFDFICCLYPTAPLTSFKKLHEGYEKLVNENFEVVLPVTAYSYPIWRGLNREENGSTQMIWPENLNKRSQDLPVTYHDAGQWYWFKREAIGRPIFESNSSSIVLPEQEVQDIDNLTDWQLAELKYALLQSTK